MSMVLAPGCCTGVTGEVLGGTDPALVRHWEYDPALGWISSATGVAVKSLVPHWRFWGTLSLWLPPITPR